MTKAPETLATARLRLRRPNRAAHAEAIFRRYAGDPEVTRLMAWPTHRSLADTVEFLAFSDAEWERWPAGPYIIEDSASGLLLGGTGFVFEAPDTAATGYILARDAWGQGYATESLRALVALAPTLGIRHFYALCHPGNAASIRLLERCGFARSEAGTREVAFPNLEPAGRAEKCFYFATRL